MGIPKNGWFAVENPWKSYEHGWFRGTPTLGNHQTVGCCSFPEKLHWKWRERSHGWFSHESSPRPLFQTWISLKSSTHFLKRIWTRSISQFWHRNLFHPPLAMLCLEKSDVEQHTFCNKLHTIYYYIYNYIYNHYILYLACILISLNI